MYLYSLQVRSDNGFIDVCTMSCRKLILLLLNCTHEQAYSLTTAPLTEQGESPLAIAVHWRSLDVMKYLVKECNATVNGESLLLMAAMLLTS